MDEFDRLLINRLQHGLPLVRQPWEALATELGSSSEALRQRVRVLGAACLSCSEWKNRRRRRSVRQRNTDRSEGPRMSARELREWEEYFNGS